MPPTSPKSDSAVPTAAPELVILGAGPAGLTAAWEAMQQGIPAVVFERDDCVGGISRTVEHNGYHFDIGGHRFFTKVEEVAALWQEILGPDMLVRPRLSRIFYDGKMFDYPIRPLNALLGLGPIEAVRVGLSFLRAQLFPVREERSFEHWVSNRFGQRLFEIFFKTYTEKVWGMDCSEIRADWAAQRIKDLDLAKTLRHALIGRFANGGAVATSLIEEFHYPRRGPGMLWERCRDILSEKGIETRLESEVVAIHREGQRVRSVELRPPTTGDDGPGSSFIAEAEHFVSSLALRDLLERMQPAPPDEVLDAARSLKYRDFLTVALAVDAPDLFPDNWIYIHAPDVRVGRIQNFGNWSPEMLPNAETSSLGLEYFVQEGDELWSMEDAKLIDLAAGECEHLGFIRREQVVDGAVVRMPKAYPVYDAVYREALDTVRAWLDGFENLTCIGRNGQHRYNNQDHSMVTALRAVRNLRGAALDIWDVNVEDDYHEEVNAAQAAAEAAGVVGDRLVPQRVEAELGEELIRSVFARYVPHALGVAVGVLAALGLFIATSTLLIAGGEPMGPTLSLLGIVLFGFEVSWPGMVVGVCEAGLLGYAFGQVLARTINRVVAWQERLFRNRIELVRASALAE